MERDRTLPDGWREERKGAALDLVDRLGFRMAWLTSDGRVYVREAIPVWQLVAIAAWAARHDA